MRAKGLSIIVLFSFFQTLFSTIVLVHLGDSIPSYIFVALEQARLFNPEIEISLIANQKAFEVTMYDFDLHAITQVFCESLARTNEHAQFLAKCPHSDAVLDGFWRKAIERFFYLHEYIALHDLKRVVHLESDNMLYASIASMQEALNQYEGIGAVFDSDYRCIPSFVYIANVQAIAQLTQFLAAHASENTFDMAFLARYKNSSTAKEIDNLPLIMPEYVKKHELINRLGQKAQMPKSYMHNNHLFQSIFDGAAIGQYLGGINPHVHANSRPGFINETCLFNPSYLKIEWRMDELGRKVPFALCEGAAYRINNLHIHSKRLHDFRS